MHARSIRLSGRNLIERPSFGMRARLVYSRSGGGFRSEVADLVSSSDLLYCVMHCAVGLFRTGDENPRG
jgi:hypothetical protein